MTYKPVGYYVIKGKFTWAQLDEILGKAEYDLLRDENVRCYQPCGLSEADVLTYKIYCDWAEGTGSSYAHVVLHPDGVCFSGSLCVEQDWNLAEELFNKVRSCFERYQSVVSEVHKEED